jgi:hypothetical protein
MMKKTETVRRGIVRGILKRGKQTFPGFEVYQAMSDRPSCRDTSDSG